MNSKTRLSTSVLTAAALMMLAGAAMGDDSGSYEATFTADGEMIRPSGWREWVFIGSPLTPNILNGGEAGFPGISLRIHRS